MGWNISQRADDLEKEAKKNQEQDAQTAAERRVSLWRMQREILKDDAKRSSGKKS